MTGSSTGSIPTANGGRANIEDRPPCPPYRFALLSGDRLPLNDVAESLALSVGGRFDGYEVELGPQGWQVGNRVDRFFEVTPEQRRQIAADLGRRGFDIVPAALRWGSV